MQIIYKLTVFFFFLTNLNATILIDESTNALEILSQSQIYIDDTKNLSFEEVKKKEFKENNEEFLAYGYAPSFAVWVKFTLKNTTDKTITKILQYDHEITSDIRFYDGKIEYKEGIFGRLKPRDSLNPRFFIELEANESKTYYLSASSYVTPLLVKLNIWNLQKYYLKEINHQAILSFFRCNVNISFL